MPVINRWRGEKGEKQQKGGYRTEFGHGGDANEQAAQPRSCSICPAVLENHKSDFALSVLFPAKRLEASYLMVVRSAYPQYSKEKGSRIGCVVLFFCNNGHRNKPNSESNSNRPLQPTGHAALLSKINYVTEEPPRSLVIPRQPCRARYQASVAELTAC